MTDTQLRQYALETARAVIGAAPLDQILSAAEEVYAFLIGERDRSVTQH